MARISNVFPEEIEPTSLGIRSTLLINTIKSFPQIRKKVQSFTNQIDMTAAEDKRQADLFVDSTQFEGIQECRDLEAVVSFEMEEALRQARDMLKKPSLVGLSCHLYILNDFACEI